MSETTTITIQCGDGVALTQERAMEAQHLFIEALQATSDEIKPGAVTWKATDFTWIDDGKNELTIHVSSTKEPTA